MDVTFIIISFVCLFCFCLGFFFFRWNTAYVTDKWTLTGTGAPSTSSNPTYPTHGLPCAISVPSHSHPYSSTGPPDLFFPRLREQPHQLRAGWIRNPGFRSRWHFGFKQPIQPRDRGGQGQEAVVLRTVQGGCEFLVTTGGAQQRSVISEQWFPEFSGKYSHLELTVAPFLFWWSLAWIPLRLHKPQCFWWKQNVSHPAWTLAKKYTCKHLQRCCFEFLRKKFKITKSSKSKQFVFIFLFFLHFQIINWKNCSVCWKPSLNFTEAVVHLNWQL